MRGVGVRRELIYLSLYCHHRNNFCIMVGSDENHFNVSWQCPQTTTVEEKGEPKRIRTAICSLEHYILCLAEYL